MYRENHLIVEITDCVLQLRVVSRSEKPRFFETVQRIGIGMVGQAVVVIVAIQVVADTVPVGIEPFARIERESIRQVAYAIPVVIGIGPIADSVAVGIRILLFVQRKVIEDIQHIVAVVIEVGAVAYSITVRVPDLEPIEWNAVRIINDPIPIGVAVGMVSNAIAIGVQVFGGVGRKRIAHVRYAIAIDVGPGAHVRKRSDFGVKAKNTLSIGREHIAR